MNDKGLTRTIKSGEDCIVSNLKRALISSFFKLLSSIKSADKFYCVFYSL